MFTTYADRAIDLGINVVAIFLLAYTLYFRRHRRADLLLAYVALNIGVFVAISLLTTVRLDVALGFGLFAMLSIIRLRSSAVTQQEVAYYFVALVMGLVNGLDINDRWLTVGINVLLLVAMLGVDSAPLRDRARRLDVTLDVVHADEASLVADLERRLGGKVMHHEVNDIDYVRGTMLVDVRYRVGKEPVAPSADERRAEVTLDVIHSNPAALVADLERRLGQVLHHRVKDIDYVRDTTVVDVRYRTWLPVATPHAGTSGAGHNGLPQAHDVQATTHVVTAPAVNGQNRAPQPMPQGRPSPARNAQNVNGQNMNGQNMNGQNVDGQGRGERDMAVRS
jgi:hypothetical protein